MTRDRRFMDPHEIADLPGTEGWREMYPSHLLFNKTNPEMEKFEDAQLWFIDSVHAPWPLKPFDITAFDMWRLALAQASNKIFAIPPSRGVDQRVVNGYIYVSPLGIDDPEEIGSRVAMFEERAGYYYTHWDELFGSWTKKMNQVMEELEQIQFNDLPNMEPLTTITSGSGFGQSYLLLNNYLKMLDNRYRSWQYHFEFNNLAYGGMVTYKQTMLQLFPGISDKAIGSSLAGFDSKLFRPTEELQKLASKAMDSNVAQVLLICNNWQEAEGRLREFTDGKTWLEAFEAARHPWFEMAIGTGWYHSDLAWNDNLDVPLTYIKNYVEALKDGKEISRPRDVIDRERDAVVRQYRGLISNEGDREIFDRIHHLARKIIPYSEDHHFYCEHWEHSVFYRKMRQIGQILVNHGILEDKEDFVYLNHFEIPQILYDVCSAWALGVKPASRYIWPSKIEQRKKIFQTFQDWSPPPALGPAPEVITEPITIAMWGITTETINNWLDMKDGGQEGSQELRGFAAGAGITEGKARVCYSVEDIFKVEDGEILVAPTTAPTWAPAFHRIKACVTDIGGVNSHAAIIAREYNLPTVVGTGYATKVIKTGDLIKVNGDNGTVSVI